MTKITEENKREIIELIHSKKTQLGTYESVATYCETSPSAITQLIKNKYNVQGDAMWIQVATKLEWSGLKTNSSTNWVFVPTTDFKIVRTIAIDAKNKSLFISISDVAGMGKTAYLKQVTEELKEEAIYYIRCWDWGKKEFLTQLCKALGIDAGRGFKTPNELLFLVIDFFQQRALRNPLLIIDEADKLKASALRFLIPLYNECEDTLGCIIAGTENLEKEIKRGVKYQAKGYDEIDSRFGRKYIKLTGCTIAEAEQICVANGVKNTKTINKIVTECKPIKVLKKIEGKEQLLDVITDLRRLKRIIQRELLNKN